MKNQEFGVITFKSTHYAIQGEKKFLDLDEISIRTIPTPREVSHSCGLALKFDLDDLEKVKSIIESEGIEIDEMYRIVKTEEERYSEKL